MNSVASTAITLSNGDKALLFKPKQQRSNKYGVVFAHWAGADAFLPKDFGGNPNVSKLIEYLVRRGITILSSDLGGVDTMGNTTEQAAYDVARLALEANGCRTGGVVGCGGSMGNASAAQYAASATGNGKLIANVSLEPACDFDDILINDRGGFQTRLASAWAVSRTDSCNTVSGSGVVADTSCVSGDVGRYVKGAGIPVGASIGSVVAGVSFTLASGVTATATANGVSLAINGPLPTSAKITTGSTVAASIDSQNIPWLCLKSSGDTVVLSSTVTAFVAAIGSTASEQTISSQDHGDPMVGDANFSNIADFLIANGA